MSELFLCVVVVLLLLNYIWNCLSLAKIAGKLDEWQRDNCTLKKQLEAHELQLAEYRNAIAAALGGVKGKCNCNPVIRHVPFRPAGKIQVRFQNATPMEPRRIDTEIGGVASGE